MADRVRDLAKRSGSRLHITKGSMSHIGSTPYTFKVDLFLSYVDNVKNATEACVVWERKGKEQATPVIKVQNGRANVRHALTMDLTMFRRSSTNKGTPIVPAEELQFDEKRIKLLLKKGSADAKSIGKIVFNLADHIKGPTTSKLFDLKLSNGSIIVAKLDATLLHLGKKKKGGTNDGDGRSEMTDGNSIENDSVFGDEDNEMGDVELLTTSSPLSNVSASPKPSDIPPITRKLSMKSEAHEDSVPLKSAMSTDAFFTKKSVKKAKDEILLGHSISLKDKLRSKKTVKKAKEAQKSPSLFSRGSKNSSSSDSQNAELKACIESLKKENAKLRASKHAAMEELEALRTDLDACEAALEEAENQLQAGGSSSTKAKDSSTTKKLQEMMRRVEELEALNDDLLEELEELESEKSGRPREFSAREKILKKKVEDLETALRREPQYLEVVHELKIAKVSLALAEMEKEQALFALQSHAPLSSIRP